MKINSLHFMIILSVLNQAYEIGAFEKMRSYKLLDEPIDVVIPAIKKDLETLDLCIEGIKENGKSIRNIYVISPEPLTTKATWIDEKSFPFSFYDIAFAIYKNEVKAKAYLAKPGNRIGWIYQQLMKLYAPFVIKGISSNILLLDSDTIFLSPVSFLNELNEPLFNPAPGRHKPYFDHAAKLIPGFKRVFDEHSGISHHMLIQKSVIEALFETIELHNHMQPWEAICHHMFVEPSGDVINVGLSEFEIYFNYIFATTKQAHIRILEWANVASLKAMQRYRAAGFHYISCHEYMRNPSPENWWNPPIGKW